ncbi:t-SNARE [Lactarius deliciosus]|nr:t-SNARE [Lactarius deliciosus]
MSFQDIESDAPQSREEAAFFSLQSSLSLQVFKINANVQGILKLVDQLGTARDSSSLRKSLHDLMEATRAMTKRGSDDLKKLSALQLSFVAFQHAQQVSAGKQRTVVKSVKLAVEEDSETLSQHAEAAPEQLQAQVMQYQESLIQEREAEIREIETGIHELSEIFPRSRYNIESNVYSIAVDTSGAAEELSTASEYQRKAGRRAACLGLVLIVVVAVVLLAVCHPFPVS